MHALQHPPLHRVDPRYTPHVLQYPPEPPPPPPHQAPYRVPRRGGALCASSTVLPWQSNLPLRSISVGFTFWRRFCVCRPYLPFANPRDLGLGLAVMALSSCLPSILAAPDIILPLVTPLRLSGTLSPCAVCRRGHLRCGRNGADLPSTVCLPPAVSRHANDYRRLLVSLCSPPFIVPPTANFRHANARRANTWRSMGEAFSRAANRPPPLWARRLEQVTCLSQLFLHVGPHLAVPGAPYPPVS